MRADRSDLDQLIKEEPSKQLSSPGPQNGSAAGRSDDRPDVVLWLWRCSSLPGERSPIPPPPLRHQRRRCSTWVTVVSRAASLHHHTSAALFLLFHTDNKPLRSVSVWRLCVLNLRSDAASSSSSTCLCWRRRTENYCWEMAETLKTLFDQNLLHCCEGKLRVS